MSRLRRWAHQAAGLLRASRREQEIAAELESHIELHIEDNLRAGMTPKEARRQAILTLGGIEMTKQTYREQGTLPLVETLLQDLRFATRQLRRNPGFALTATLMLAVGIAASVAIFAFVDAALIQPLPYANPTRLISITESIALFGRANLSYPDYLDWKKSNHTLTSLDVYGGDGFMLPPSQGSELVQALTVSDGFFRTLGVKPILGRDFYTGEDLPSASKTTILSYPTWQKRFAGRTNIIGQSILLSGEPFTIVGVLPQSFQFAPSGGAEFFSLLHPSTGCLIRRSCHSLVGIGRLKDGVSLPTAQAEFTTIAQQLERQYPDSNKGQGASAISLTDAFLGDVRPILLTLLGGAALLLLIACVDVASLLLVRSESRRREIAIRAALGVSRARLRRQFFTEGLLLVALGSLIGVLAANLAMRLLLRLLSKDMLTQMPYLEHLGLTPHTLLFAALVAVLATIVFSATPMLRLSGIAVSEGLAEGSRGSAGLLWRKLGSNLVVLELAIAMVLLVGAGLLGKSFYRLLHVDLGFDPTHLATVRVAFPQIGYEKEDRQIAATQQILDRVHALPGVQSVATTSVAPVSGNGNTVWIRFVGRPYDGKHIEINTRDVTTNYFAALKASLRGRPFTDQDDLTHPLVVIVNQTFAKKYFPGEDPIGKHYGNTSLDPKSLRTIVGVVDDIREATLDTETIPTEYLPFRQSPDTYYILLARTVQPPELSLPAIVAAIHAVSPDIGTVGESTLLRDINESQSAYLHRSSAWLVGGFALLALLLGVVGLYGVIAYSVSQRTREIGVRMALGAERTSVYALILKEAGLLTGIGIAVGLLCAVGAATLMRTLLFGTAAWDAATLLTVAAILATSAMAASFLPAHRAASVNPVEALRAE